MRMERGFHPALWGVLIGIGIGLSGCATIFSEGKDTITFNANVNPVRVFVDGSFVGETPLTRDFNRKLGEYHLKFVKQGYETQEFNLAHEFNNNAGMWLDITGTATTLTPMGVNALSGNLIKFTPNDYQIEMLPEKKADETTIRKRLASRRFAAFNFDTLRAQVAAGKGEHLEALADSFAIHGNHRKDFQNLIREHREELLTSRHGLELWNALDRHIHAHPKLKSCCETPPEPTSRKNDSARAGFLY